MIGSMEFEDVVRRRRMVRRYAPDPVDPALVERALRNAHRAPSAGFTQGWAFLVLDTPADVDRFWAACTPPERLAEPDSWLRGMRTAPVVVVPLCSESAYRARYAAPDKQRAGTDREWPVPYWHTDTAMAALLMLLTAVDEGLGACFFGIPASRTETFRDAFGVPDDHTPVGAVTLGHRAGDRGATGSPSRRRRRPLEEVVHRGGW
jgi:nitroreductase